MNLDKILAGEIVRFRRVVFLNMLTLIGAILLFLLAYLIAVLQFNVSIFWSILVVIGGFMMLLFGLIFLIVIVRIFLLNVKFIKGNSGVPSRHIILGVYTPLVLAALIYVSTPIMYKRVENFERVRLVRQVTPLKRTISDICDNMFRDPEYISEIPGGVGSYFQVADNDHVLIWEDTTGDAYWFDTADSLSSGGYVCIRPGIPLDVAISDYEFKKTQRDFIKVFDGLYSW